MVLVAEQRESELVLVTEVPEVGDRVGRDAENDGAGSFVVGGVVADAAGLGRATGGAPLGQQ
jgi:hypothetical protein